MADTNTLMQILTGQAPSILNSTQKALSVEHQALQNQSTAQELRAREALGPILQTAIDPKTGKLDYNKAFVLMASNPDVAFMAPEFLDKAIARQATQASTAMQILDRNIKQQNAIYEAVTARLTKARKGTLTHQDLLTDAKELKNAGLIDDEHYINFHNTIKALPQSALYDYARSAGMRAQGAAKTMESVYPNIERSDPGGEIVFTQSSPTEGIVRPVGRIPKGLTPEKKGELIEGIDIDGSITGLRGSPYKLPYEQIFGNGKTPVDQARARTESTGAGETQISESPPQQRGPKLLITGRPPQEAEALRRMGEEYTGVVQLANVNKKFGIALDEGERLMKDYQPGAGAEVRARLARGLKGIGISDEIVNKIANGSLAKSEAYKSVMLDVAVGRLKQAMSGTGQISNLEFSTYGDNKPNPEMEPEAIRDLVNYYRKVIKLEDAYVQGYFHFLDPRSGKNPLDFQKWWQGVMKKVKKAEEDGRNR